MSPAGARVLSRAKETLIKGTRHSLAPAGVNGNSHLIKPIEEDYKIRL